jgi:phosphoribosyl 1,2-cyclic phosphodiesterase
MGLRFTVLASGSGGNASLIEADGFGVLLDAGLGPRQLASRLADAGSSWAAVHAVLLTHTHSDHWKDRTLAHLCRCRIPLYCHPGHHAALHTYAPSFPALLETGLVQPFAPGEELALAPQLRCWPLPLSHDGGATFGFRLEGGADLFGPATALAYAADLGCWDEGLVGGLADVDLLAIEFNHDVDLELRSGRFPGLIARVLGDEGHLSNAQAAGLLRAVLARSPAGRLQHVVQLHLSRDCNRPALAHEAAQVVLGELAPGVELHTARQDQAGATLHLNGIAGKRRRGRPAGSRRAARPSSALTQRWLFGSTGAPAEGLG